MRGQPHVAPREVRAGGLQESNGLPFHPSNLGLGREVASRQRAYAELLAPSADPQADGRDARWTTKRAVGSLGVLACYGAHRGWAAKMAAVVQN